MNLTDRKQQVAISIMAGTVTILAAVVGFVTWIENKRHAKLNDEVLKLDMEIKKIELAQKRKQIANGVLA